MYNFNIEDALADVKLIRNSIYYAMYSRLDKDSFCNFFELNVQYKEESKIDNLVKYIKNIYTLSLPYIPEESFFYSYPKGDFFLRRCTYLPFKEFAVRYHLINILSLKVENSFINKNFAFRTQRSKSGFIHLFPDYYPSYKKFITWAENILVEYKNQNIDSYILNADITSFYDSISHDDLVDAIFRITGNSLSPKYESLLHQILIPKVESYSIINKLLQLELKRHGLLIGNSTEGYLANILLNRLDELMISCGFSYARYVDDIRVITKTKEEVIKAVNIIQEELHRIGLNLNSSKTAIIHNPKSVEDLFRKDHEISLFDQLNEISNSSNSEEENAKSNVADIISIVISQKLEKEDAQKITKFLFNIEYSYEKLKLNYDYNEEVLIDEDLLILLIEKIPEIIRLSPKTIGSNTWSVVKFITFGFPNQIIFAAYKAMNEIFKDKTIMDYARTRLIHHLVKPRKKDPPYILMIIKNNEKLSQKLISIFQNFLSNKSIDLSLNALYALWILSHRNNGTLLDQDLFLRNINDYLPRPLPYNISRVLSSVFSHEDDSSYLNYIDFKNLSNNSEKLGLDDFNY